MRSTKGLIQTVVILFLMGGLSIKPAQATENGGCAFPVGAETILTAMQPDPGHTMLYEYTVFYNANEFDDSKGAKELTEFKLRIFASAVKVAHAWDFALLGGHPYSYASVPVLYEEVHVSSGIFSKSGLGNVDIVPMGLNYHKGLAHWYYEADFFMRGAPYTKGDVVNTGQNYFSAGPVVGFTLLPNNGRTEISSRITYLFNGYDDATKYHSGNEFFTEFNVDQSIGKTVTVGFNGAIYQQTTDDYQNGLIFQGGYRGRDLQVGPQIRLPLGKHAGIAFKYYRDTLVQNKSRGNTFWFQMAIPLGHAGI